MKDILDRKLHINDLIIVSIYDTISVGIVTKISNKAVYYKFLDRYTDVNSIEFSSYSKQKIIKIEDTSEIICELIKINPYIKTILDERFIKS